MTAMLPDALLEVFERSVTTEFVTVDGRGQPIAVPVRSRFTRGASAIELATEEARRAAANPHVALLFAELPAGGRQDAPMVLVQGTAAVDEARVQVRPERVYAWPERDPEREPELLDAHLEEVRSGHNEEPEEGHAAPDGGGTTWAPTLDGLGRDVRTAALAVVGPDGFPFAVRVPVRADRDAGLVHVEADPVGAPLEPGLACLLARTLQICGDLVRAGDGWALAPHRIAGGD